MMLTTTEHLKLDGEYFVREYLATGEREYKDKVVSSFAPLIKYVIGRFNLSYSSTLEKDDLYQAGIFGLLKALDRYRPEKGVPFKSFAYKRIHGEVVDTLRKEGLIGRDKYEKVKKVEETIRHLSSEFGREPSIEEVCRALDISDTEYYSILNASQMVYTTSLNAKIYDGDGEFVYRIDTLSDDDQMTPEDFVTDQNLKENLKKVINELSERQKIIFALYYYEELTLADIGKVVGLTEARISQIINKTLVEIKVKLDQ
jgi:RNA polymerase sigma factor for flagellar operon FliA